MFTNYDKTKFYDKAPRLWNIILCSLVSLAFILSDWIIMYSSFGDFILAILLLLLIILGQYKVPKKYWKYLMIPVVILILNFVLNVNFNNYWFNSTRAIRSYSKILLYILTLIMFYSFLIENKLTYFFLKSSNFFAVLTILVGIILTISIYLNIAPVFNTLWTFTRTDEASYLFAETTNIVRMRSLFSEPAHFGYYLNSVFFANLFTKRKNQAWVMLLLSLGILLTLSYSMILIFIVTNLLYIITQMINGNFNWSRWYLVSIMPILIFIVYYWDFINVTIIQRTMNILSGSDSSAYNRIIESWIYVAKERIIFGNGIAHSPPMTNIYAYVLTDFGLVGFIPYIAISVLLLKESLALFVYFVLMNSAKGGYLTPSYWLFMFFVLFMINEKKTN